MISIIVAVARGGVIGSENKLLWHISEDLKRFKAITSGHPVIMGRKTYESLGRPLPNRTNVVITRNSSFEAHGCVIANSLEQALEMFPKEQEVFIIGGAQIYEQALPIADKFYLTQVDASYEGDTMFPEWDSSQWSELSREHRDRGENYPHPFTFIDYIRKR